MQIYIVINAMTTLFPSIGTSAGEQEFVRVFYVAVTTGGAKIGLGGDEGFDM